MISGLKARANLLTKADVAPAMERAFSARIVYAGLPGAMPQAGISPRLWR